MEQGKSQAARVRLPLLGLVALGATLGTLLRVVIEGAFPFAPGSWPWSTFVINIVGSFLLGSLVEALARRGEDVGRRRALRLGLGTGVLGGFTTYSTFVMEVVALEGLSGMGPSAGYALVSIALGIAAAGAGIALVGRLARPQTPEAHL